MESYVIHLNVANSMTLKGENLMLTLLIGIDFWTITSRTSINFLNQKCILIKKIGQVNGKHTDVLSKKTKTITASRIMPVGGSATGGENVVWYKSEVKKKGFPSVGPFQRFGVRRANSKQQ